jgi:membrane protease YdiL (CAAX protease family)
MEEDRESRYRWLRLNTKLPKTFGSPTRVIATCVAKFLFSQVIAEALVGLILTATNSSTGGAASLLESAPAQFFYVLLAELGAVLFVFYVLKRRGLSLSKIGLGRRPQVKDVGKALLGFGIFFLLLIVSGLLVSLLFPQLNADQTQDVGFNDLKTSLDYTIAFVALVFLPPIGEEILVRGYLYSGLRTYWKILPAMVVTSLIFGAAHLQTGSGVELLWIAAIDTFVLSVVLVYLRENTGALYAGMLVHGLNNMIAFGVHFRGL